MMEARRLALLLVSLLALSVPAQGAGLPERRGFTWEFGMGVGALEVMGRAAPEGNRLDVGLEPHCISLGGFINSRMALMYRWSSAYYFATNAAGRTAQGVFGTHGLQMQFWPTDRWSLAGGPALAFFGNVLGHHDADPPIKVGYALTARAGYTFAQVGAHAFKVEVNLLAGFFGDLVALGQTVNLAYQWL